MFYKCEAFIVVQCMESKRTIDMKMVKSAVTVCT